MEIALIKTNLKEKKGPNHQVHNNNPQQQNSRKAGNAK